MDEPGSPSRTRVWQSGVSSSSPSSSWTQGSACPTERRGAGVCSACAGTMSRMSHLDELDEYEAELELRLKREYTAVFGLFRYCVVTQDSTYLCNKLDLKVLPADELSLLPPDDGGRLGLGQEPADADHPARRGLHVERRHDRGAARRGRRARRSRPRRSPRSSAKRPPAATTSPSTERGAPALVTDFACASDGRRRQHADGVRPLRRRRAWPSTGGSRPRPSAPATSSAALLARLLELRDLGFEDIGGVCLSSTVPPLVRAYEELAERLRRRRRCSWSVPGRRPASRSSTTTHARSGPTGSSTPSPRRSATARRASSSTSARRRTSTSCRADGRVRRRRPRAGDRDLDGSPLRARGAAREGRFRRPPAS